MYTAFSSSIISATQRTIEMTQKMADVGADAVIVVTPCYYKASMTPDAFLYHYTQVVNVTIIMAPNQ